MILKWIYKMWLEWAKQKLHFSLSLLNFLSNIYTFTKLVSQHFLNEKTAIDKLLISNCENNLRKQCTIGNFVTIRIWNVLRTVLLSPHWWHTLPRSLWWTILNQKRCPNVKTIFQFSLNVENILFKKESSKKQEYFFFSWKPSLCWVT